MRSVLTQAIEDYLKAIYELTVAHGRVSTNQLAERLNITPASVTGMIQRMAAADPPLVDYQKHRGVRLTEEGRTIALEIIRHHRLIELFLHQTLGYSWDEVHEEADRLEHVISEDFEERISQALGNPSHDPHGEPIPTRDLQIPHSSHTRLSELRPGQEATVNRVDASDMVLLRYLSEIGLTPNAELSILDYSSFDGNLRLQVAGKKGSIVLGPGVTGRIFVEETSD
jgi:DtxR family transcriptional regulator, Mn-dependent transcriptional regulator